MASPAPLVVGFLGTGTLASCMITGYCLGTDVKDIFSSILVSPRNAEKAEKLRVAYPDFVQIAADNQTLIDRAQVVIVTILPKDAPAILGPLQFRADQLVISCMALLHSTVCELVQPATTVIRAVPMPPCAKREGPILQCPPNPEAARVLGPIGSVVQTETFPQLEALQVTTCMMASYYSLLAHMTDWAVTQGVDRASATTYVGCLFRALSVDADATGRKGEDFHALTAESQTPGGLNEQMLKALTASGWHGHLNTPMDAVLARLQGRPAPTAPKE